MLRFETHAPQPAGRHCSKLLKWCSLFGRSQRYRECTGTAVSSQAMSLDGKRPGATQKRDGQDYQDKGSNETRRRHMDAEQGRLEEARSGHVAWKKWGPYLSDRQ